MTLWHQLTAPQFTPLFVLIACLVFAWIGWTMRDDDGPNGGAV